MAKQSKIYRGTSLFSVDYGDEGYETADGAVILFEKFWPNGEIAHQRIRAWSGCIDHSDIDDNGVVVRVIETEAGAIPDECAVPLYGTHDAAHKLYAKFKAAWDAHGGMPSEIVDDFQPNFSFPF